MFADVIAKAEAAFRKLVEEYEAAEDFLMDLVAELRALHSPFRVCMECDGDECAADHLTMMVCEHCCTVNGLHTETCADLHDHAGVESLCPTIEIVNKFGGGHDAVDFQTTTRP